MSSLPGPFELEPVFLPKVWAAPHLPPEMQEIFPAPAGCGELWLASDRLHITKVAGGPLAGLGLDEVTRRFSDHLLGPESDQGFPLLAKVLVVGDWLSVQVHPDDESARRLENQPWGKSEAWLVFDAGPDAQLVDGFMPGATAEAIERATRQGGLVELLAKVPAKKGDVFHLPAGVVHALGPGLCLFELQQASDVTYRFYDWDRPDESGNPRPLHQKRALEVVNLTGPGRPLPPQELAPAPNLCNLLVNDEHFALLKWDIKTTCSPQFGGRRLRVFTVLAGQGSLLAAGHEPTPLLPGQTWVCAHGLEALSLSPGQGGLTVLESVALGGS